MSTPLREEVLKLREPTPQASLPLAVEGVQRYVWEHRYGSMLIEVIGDEVRVDGQVVRPLQPREAQRPPGTGT